MISPRVRRRAAVLAVRILKTARTHCFSLLSAAVIAALAVVALSSDTFQTSRPTTAQKQPARPITPASARLDYGSEQYAVVLAWSQPVTPEELAFATAYFSDTTRLTPLERARLRPSRPRSTGSESFPVILPDLTSSERAEALLTAIADAEALGLRVQLTEDPDAQD